MSCLTHINRFSLQLSSRQLRCFYTRALCQPTTLVRSKLSHAQGKTIKGAGLQRFLHRKMPSQTVKLNNGAQMPLIGLGCWKIPNAVCAEQVYEAIKLGYRAFDGAEDYGNEKEVGEGIKRAISEGIVKREDLFVISKLWNNYHHPENVRPALERTLKDLQLEYLDLFYIHFPIAFKFVPFEENYPPNFYTGKQAYADKRFEFENVPLLDTYRALEKLHDEGLIKAIGVSNFSAALVYDLLRGARVKPAALQIEHHPYLTQEKTVKWVQDQGIQVVAYSSFGPQSFIELDHPAAKVTEPLFQHKTITTIAEKHGVEASQVLLRWATQRGIAVIPKSSQKERLLQNLEIDDKFDLTEEELKEISALNKDLRFNDPWTWFNAEIPIFY